jgi:hypothetical protein
MKEHPELAEEISAKLMGSDERVAAFENYAHTSPEEAAAVIVEGIKKKKRKWRILIGQDAVNLDQLQRSHPEDFHENLIRRSFMFKFEPGAFYTMPFHFGPHPLRGSAIYGDVTTIAITYLTDRKLLVQYLPPPFEVGQDPLITVYYGMNRQIEWLAGGSYNILGVDASVSFKGKVDQLAGNYCLVLWENLTDPILRGREMQGIPKIYAEIPDPTIHNGVWQTCAAYRGHKIVDLAVKDLKPQGSQELKEFERIVREGNWMGWKYIPKTGEPGAEVSHPTLFPTETNIKEVSIGAGEVKWHRLTWEQNPTQFHIANALESLPILEYRFAGVIKGSQNLIVPGKPVRPLR